MGNELKVLLVEDLATDAELAARELRRAGIACVARRVETETELRQALDEFAPDIILSDFTLPRLNALAALAIQGPSNVLIRDEPAFAELLHHTAAKLARRAYVA